MTAKEFEIEILPCHGRMYAVALAVTGDADDAGDAVQDAMTRLWERRGELSQIQCKEAYCVTVVKRICLDRLRRDSRMTTLEEPAMADAPDCNVERRMDDSWLLNDAVRLMRELPEQQRRVLELSAMGGLDNAEIAQAEGLTHVNVRALLSRGRRRLRKLFENEM